MRFKGKPAPAQPHTTHRAHWWRGKRGAAIVALAVALGTGLGAVGADAVSSAPSSVQASPHLPGFTQGYVPVDGGTLHYVRGGSGPVLVLLHGWPETWYEWRNVMPDLARTHTVVAFDLPGLGNSSVPTDGGYDAAHTAVRIHQAVTELGYAKVSILSHDLGALVGYAYARDFPGDVSLLAVLETPLNGFGLESAYSLSWHFLFNQSPAPVPEDLINDKAHVRTYFDWLFSSAKHPNAIAQSTYIDAYANAAHRSAGFDYYRAFPANAADNQANASKKLTIPVLAMGAQFVFGPAVAASFSNVATDVHEVVAPDSGHWIPEENPQFLEQCADLFFGSGTTQPPAPDLAGCVP
jgi:pimeloyl-ACP methyl ester carboxylesterase